MSSPRPAFDGAKLKEIFDELRRRAVAGDPEARRMLEEGTANLQAAIKRLCILAEGALKREREVE